MHNHAQQQVQQRKVQQLQRQQAAEQSREQRQQLALETANEAMHGQRVWIIPEFDPDKAERKYLIEAIRDAVPEYNVQMATDSTQPMTKDRIYEMLAGDEGGDGDAE